MPKSNLKIYSLGIVVKTKIENEDTILVSPIEHLSMQSDGLLINSKRTYTNKIGDLNNKSNKSEIKATDYLTATWINLGNNNRMSAPDVVHGETVLLFKFGDVDTYYWTTIFREPSLRRLESIYYVYSNLPTGMDSFNKNTSYWFNVDTRHKKIQLHTSKNDKELCGYDIIIDTKKGSITINDTLNNKIELLSNNGILNINTNNQVNVTTKSLATVTAPNIILTGNVTINGNLNINGNTNVSGSVIDGGGNTNHHVH